MVGAFGKKFATFRAYNRAAKLANDGKFGEAIQMLDKIDGTPLYEAKALLFKATLFHKDRRYSDAVTQYTDFMDHGSQAIKRDADRDYLCAYAAYWRALALRTNNTELKQAPNPTELRKLHDLATLATRGEFPFTQ